MATVENRNYLDKIIEPGVIFLLIFTPLAFGTVQVWSIAVMEITAFIIFGAWLLALLIREDYQVVKTPLLYLFGALTALILFQLLPMPINVLSMISPSSAAIYEKFTDNATNAWHTASINASATKEELYKVAAYIMVFTVITNKFRTREQIKQVIRTIVILGCFLSIFAIAQKMTWNGKLYWIYPVTPGLHSNSGYIWGPYINHNHFAAYLEMAIPLCLGALVYRLSRFKSSAQVPLLKRLADLSADKNFLVAALLFLAVLIMSASLFVCLSRGGILGFIASVICFTIMSRARRSLRNKTGIILMTGIILFATTIFASWDRIEDRFGEIGEVGKIKRTEVWTDAVKIVKDFPVFGTGLGTFKSAYPLYQSTSPNLLFQHAENDYVEILTDVGAAGFLIIFGMQVFFLTVVVKAWRKRHNSFVLCIGAGGVSSCAAIAVHSLTDFNMRIPANAMLLTVIAAITWSAVFNIGADSSNRARNFKNDQTN